MRFTRIKETCIYVKDLDRTEEFYRGRLGLELIAWAEGRHIFFRAGESVLLCFIAGQTMKEETLPAHGARGSVHFAFEVEPGDYDRVKKELSAKIDIVHEQEWKYGLRSFYFHDPDMNLVEVVMRGLWERP